MSILCIVDWNRKDFSILYACFVSFLYRQIESPLYNISADGYKWSDPVHNKLWSNSFSTLSPNAYAIMIRNKESHIIHNCLISRYPYPHHIAYSHRNHIVHWKRTDDIRADCRIYQSESCPSYICLTNGKLESRMMSNEWEAGDEMAGMFVLMRRDEVKRVGFWDDGRKEK